jgi:predicted nucleic acid-binding protein
VIAVDSSAWIAYFAAVPGTETEAVERALAAGQACLPPVVLTELLSDPALPRPVAELLLQLPLLAPMQATGTAGRLRAGCWRQTQAKSPTC